MIDCSLYICPKCGHQFLPTAPFADYNIYIICACGYESDDFGFLWQPRNYDVICCHDEEFHLTIKNYKKRLRKIKKIFPLTRRAYKYLRKRFKRKFAIEKGEYYV